MSKLTKTQKDFLETIKSDKARDEQEQRFITQNKFDESTVTTPSWLTKFQDPIVHKVGEKSIEQQFSDAMNKYGKSEDID